ncbi:NUDIX hydrolase [soil metagenome]
MTDAVPIPAATLVLFRERAGAAPELLIVQRAREMVFAAGALVFPGGRIDPGDRALSEAFPGDPDDMAGRIAAIRETIEESGIVVGLMPIPGEHVAIELRAAMQEGAGFADALADAGLSIDPDALTPFARWCPNHPERRIFDTRFYLARLPEGAPEPVVDATENSRAFWASAQGVLDQVAAGDAHVIFPTRRNLERLALHASFDHAVADAIARPVRTVTPWIETRDGRDHLCIPDDLGYPITSEALAGVIRG